MDLPQLSRFVLLSHRTSRANKLALVADYRARDFFVEWRWKGPALRSRLEFRFAEGNSFLSAQSYEEDIAPLLKDRMGGSP